LITKLNLIITYKILLRTGIIHITALLLFVLCALVTEAQVIKGAVIAGTNLSQVDGDEVYGFNKLGLNVGAAAIIPLHEKWELSVEALFSQKGSRQTSQYDDSLTGEYKLKLAYMEVPVLAHFNDKDIVKFGLGLSWGRLISVEEYEHGIKVDSTTLNGGPYSRNDFNAIADVKFRIYKRLKFNVRYAYSIVKIRTRLFEPPYSTESWTRKQYNNFWSFRLIYVINETQSERTRRQNRVDEQLNR